MPDTEPLNLPLGQDYPISTLVPYFEAEGLTHLKLAIKNYETNVMGNAIQRQHAEIEALKGQMKEQGIEPKALAAVPEEGASPNRAARRAKGPTKKRAAAPDAS